MLFLYGRPGVGKTALAVELAHELRFAYPHGQLFVDLGVAGGRRSEHDILRVFLKGLGWPDDELRDIVDLDNAFRTVTAKRRLLIVLDAARDARQIEAVLPGGDRCAVIVTSRANLAGTEHDAWQVRTPSPEEAARILRAYLTTDIDPSGDVKMPSAELIAEASELCGGQPIALRAVGERARHAAGGLEEVVSRLRNPQDRLKRLAYGGHDAAGRIATEYYQLGRQLQLALQALVLVDSPSFVPWVIQPLLNVSLPEAANLMAALSEVGLLDELRADPAGFPRYGFSLLVRLFAERELRMTLASEEAHSGLLSHAKDNLRLGLLVLAKKINEELDPNTDFGNDPDIEQDWIPTIRNWRERVAENTAFWIRSEFDNLIEVVFEAHRRKLCTLAWRISAQLDDCDVVHSFSSPVRGAFEGALQDAAGVSDNPLAVASVRLAEGTILFASERYGEAIANLDDVVQTAGVLKAHGISARANRLIGQAEQRLGEYSAANRHLRAALDDVRLGAMETAQSEELNNEARIIRSLLAENDFYTNPTQWAGSRPHGADLCNAKMNFVEHLMAARMARHQGDPKECQEELRKAVDAIDGYDSFAFQLQCERISCVLSNLRLSHAERAGAIAAAAHIVVVSADAGARLSNAEARILLARALLADGQSTECLSTLASLRINQIYAKHESRLRGQQLRLQGEAQLALGALGDAEHSLSAAADKFCEINEFWNQAETHLVLGLVQQKAGQWHDAQISFLSAMKEFRQCGDARNTDRALALLGRPALILAARIICARVRCRLRRISVR